MKLKALPPHEMNDERQQNVARYLQSQEGPWVGRVTEEVYSAFSRDQMIRKANQVYAAVKSETDADAEELALAYERSVRFIHDAFDFYEAKKSPARDIARAFIVPMRASRFDESYSGEWESFYPLLNRAKFGVDSEISMRAIYGLPPTILDTYTRGTGAHEAGALVLCPLYADMSFDLAPSMNQTTSLLSARNAVIDATARFAHLTLGSKVVGLGGTLPNITRFGNALKATDSLRGLITTTGHGGTVYMIVRTIQEIRSISHVDSAGWIGIFGAAGSIGWASVRTILQTMPEHNVLVWDKRLAALRRRVSGSGMGNRVSIASSACELFEKTRIVVAAITERIDLDRSEFEGVDLAGRIIVDDSQPSAFDINQVERRGGKVVWVVREDRSDSQFIVRDGFHSRGRPSNYGATTGLHGIRSEFACGQEAAVIARTRDYSAAITGPVTPEDVSRIGKHFVEQGVSVAPFQAFGRLVHL